MSKSTIIAVLAILLVVGMITFFVSKNGRSVNKQAIDVPSEVNQPTEDQSTLHDTVSPESTIKETSEISLSISSPLSGSTSKVSKVIVKGKTTPKAEVFVNEAEGIADINGYFSLSVSLDEGENSIIVTAVDESGKVAEKEILVTYEINE